MVTPDKSGTSPRDEHTKTDIEAIKRELEDIRKERMELDQKENLILIAAANILLEKEGLPPLPLCGDASSRSPQEKVVPIRKMDQE
jgi:hypothetical protein